MLPVHVVEREAADGGVHGAGFLEQRDLATGDVQRAGQVVRHGGAEQGLHGSEAEQVAVVEAADRCADRGDFERVMHPPVRGDGLGVEGEGAGNGGCGSEEGGMEAHGVLSAEDGREQRQETPSFHCAFRASVSCRTLPFTSGGGGGQGWTAALCCAAHRPERVRPVPPGMHPKHENQPFQAYLIGGGIGSLAAAACSPPTTTSAPGACSARSRRWNTLARPCSTRPSPSTRSTRPTPWRASSTACRRPSSRPSSGSSGRPPSPSSPGTARSSSAATCIASCWSSRASRPWPASSARSTTSTTRWCCRCSAGWRPRACNWSRIAP